MKKLTAVAIVLVIMLVSIACASAKAPAPSPAPAPAPAPAPTSPSFSEGFKDGAVYGPPTPTPTPAPVPRPTPAPSMPSGGTGFVEEADSSWATERMIVRTGNISLLVEDVLNVIEHITQLADRLNGYVVSSRSWREGNRLVGAISIRVPAESFDDAMRELRGLAVEVNSETTSSKDVTEEYIDLSAKLHNLEATEVQLLKLMEKAETVPDILEVQRELSNTRGQIEQTKGRMQYLERTSETSLIDINLEQSKLDVKFNADRARVKEGEGVRFFGEIAGGFAPYSYEWDFGDGNTSTAEMPFYTYESPGIYTVSLSVTDDRGNQAAQTRSDYLTVLPGWSAGSVVSGAWNGLATFGQVMADILIWVGVFSPVWIAILGVLYWWRRRRRKKA